VTPKHSLQATASSSATHGETTLRRVRVPLGQSWAAVYWELQAQNIEVAIGRRLKVFAVGGGLPAGRTSEIRERLRQFRAMFRQQKTRRLLICVLGGFALVPMFLLTATSFAAVELPESPSQPARTAESKPIVAQKPKCQLSKEQAETDALSQDKWNRLGGVGYTHVTLRCSGKVVDYQIVKNLISGSIVSTKQVG
jgi:hypothetical protein